MVDRTTVTSTTKKAIAAVTAAGLLTLGGASAAFAAERSQAVDPRDGTAASAREHPRALRAVVKTSFTAAADALGMTTEELRAAVTSGPQSIASVAGDRSGAVIEAVTTALNAQLDEAVSNGSVSIERAERARARIPTFTERFVNRVPGERLR